jgi:hypothetical protein
MFYKMSRRWALEGSAMEDDVAVSDDLTKI